MSLSEVLAAMTREGDFFSASVPDTWLQGRSVFGGMQSALALAAMRAFVPRELPLRVLQTTFVTPVPAGPVRLRAAVLRSGKSAVHAEARIVAGDQVACIVVGVFGAARPSRAIVVPKQREIPHGEPLTVAHVAGLTPSFTQHFVLRWLQGGLPYTGTKEPGAIVEVDMREEGHATEVHLLAIADAVPPMALSMLDTPAPGSSLTWTIEMLGADLASLPLSGYRLDCDLVAGRDGYTSQSVMVWGPGAEPVALSRQSMVVFG
jgi:acyl-CoA thioesterase